MEAGEVRDFGEFPSCAFESEVHNDAVAPSSWYSVRGNTKTGHEVIHYTDMA